MDILYSRKHQAERLIVTGRIVLAAFSLLAIWLDPSILGAYAQTTYTLLVLYLGYALLLVPLVWRPILSLSRLGLITHLVDLPVFTLFLYLTAGSTSPLFVYFIFFLLAATLRWQVRGIVWSAIVALVVFIFLGMYSAQSFEDSAFELNRFIIRSVSLVIVAILLAYLSTYEQQLHSELAKLAGWSRDIPHEAEGLAQEVLKNAVRILNAPRALLVWEESEEPWRYVVTYFQGEFHYTREPPSACEPLVAESLAGTHFLCLNTRVSMPIVFHTSAVGLRCWRGAPLHPDLQSRFAIGNVLALHLRGEGFQGRLFMLDRRVLTSDELLLGEIVARQVTDDMNRFYAQQRLQRMATLEERMHLARDLHDGVLQSLTSTVLQLDKARDLVKKDPEAAQAYLMNLQALLVAEQRELRIFVQQMKSDISSPMEANPSLTIRLEALCKRIEQQWHLPVELIVELTEQQISRTLTESIYHIVQEALVNAARHAHASIARVKLAIQDRQLHIIVMDNGCGFPFHGHFNLDELADMKLGPVSLKERLISLGGELAFDSTESGTRLEIILSLVKGNEYADQSRFGR